MPLIVNFPANKRKFCLFNIINTWLLLAESDTHISDSDKLHGQHHFKSRPVLGRVQKLLAKLYEIQTSHSLNSVLQAKTYLSSILTWTPKYIDI